MKKLLAALAVTTTLSLGFCGAPAFATPMVECTATGIGDTDAAVIELLTSKWPQDAIYLFVGEDMHLILAAAMFAAEVTSPPPADTTEVWVSTGPGGDGSTVFLLFAEDCYLGSFNFSQEKFELALGMAFGDNPPAPVKESGQGTRHTPVIPLAGARSA